MLSALYNVLDVDETRGHYMTIPWGVREGNAKLAGGRWRTKVGDIGPPLGPEHGENDLIGTCSSLCTNDKLFCSG